jgi:hypothetical protein
MIYVQVQVRSDITSIVFSSNVQKIILYIRGPLVSNRFCIDAQSLLWLCQVSQSLTLRERGRIFCCSSTSDVVCTRSNC